MNKLGITTALNKISKLDKPIRVVQGGQGSSKTFSILMLLINSCQHKAGLEVSVLQAERTKMKRTVVRDFIKIMTTGGFFVRESWNKTELTYRFPNGSYIEFLGLDASGIAKGFRRDIVYFNEANVKISYEMFVGFQSRATITYLDYNPDQIFFSHKELIGNDNVDFIILTYEDNEYLPVAEKTAILAYRDRGLVDVNGDVNEPSNIKNEYYWNKWLVYGLGVVGKVSGAIITDWEVIDSIPDEARLLGTGVDFGFSNDETAISNIYKLNDSIVVDELLFRKGMSISDIVAYLKNQTIGVMYCDAAEPRSISELNRYGIKSKGAPKGRDSVTYGLDLLRSRHIMVTSRSRNIIEAFEGYSWEKDTDGNFINKPNHYLSDIVDAIRYGVVSLFGKKHTGKYAIR